MTLSFSETINDKPSYFIEKIWASIDPDGSFVSRKGYENRYSHKFGKSWDWIEAIQTPKHHTIRADRNNNWKKDNKIHFVINNRTKSRFQFAPIKICKSVQAIRVLYPSDSDAELLGLREGSPLVYLSHWDERKKEFGDLMLFHDGSYGKADMHNLAINDGFDSVSDFFQYFNKDFDGKIIHWTPLKY